MRRNAKKQVSGGGFRGHHVLRHGHRDGGLQRGPAGGRAAHAGRPEQYDQQRFSGGSGRSVVHGPFGGPVFQFVGQPAWRCHRGPLVRRPAGLARLLPADAAGGHRGGDVPHHESGGHHPVLRDTGRHACVSAARRLGGHRAEKLPHGLFLEYVRRVPVHPLGLPAALCGQRPTAFCGKKRPAFVHGGRAFSVYWNCWMYRAERRNRQYT